jgi:hypothetical protein
MRPGRGLMMQLYNLYVHTFWPLITGVLVWGLYARRHDLVRCSVVLGGGQVAIDLWTSQLSVANGQPWYVYLTINALSCIALTVLPSSRLCSTLGGLFLAGAGISIIHGSFYWTNATEWLYWQNTLLLGWAMLLVLAGGATGETGRRFIHRLWRGLVSVVIPARSGGVA